MPKILVTGGTGLIGKQLCNKLEKKGHKIVILTRNPKENNQFLWNIKNEYIDDKAFEKITHIIHLAGSGIAEKRWSKEVKQEIIDSRVKSTELLLKKIKGNILL